MNYNKKTVRDIDVAGKKVLLRCDFNVPMAKDGSGVITDDKRIRAALPTIQYLLDQGAAVIACSHLGKPKGEVKPELSLKPVSVRLSELLGIGADECTEDGKFSLTACRCIGACGLAPVMTINDDVYGRLVADDIPGILAKYAD